MTYAFVQDVPANAEIYSLIRAKLGNTPPDGLLAHIAMVREGGLRYVDVWETEEAWNQYRDEHLERAVGEVLASFGLPHDHSVVTIEPVEVIDLWLGESTAKIA